MRFTLTDNRLLKPKYENEWGERDEMNEINEMKRRSSLAKSRKIIPEDATAARLRRIWMSDEKSLEFTVKLSRRKDKSQDRKRSSSMQLADEMPVDRGYLRIGA
jgi:hypothetical protein